MLLTIPDSVAPTVAIALRLHAEALASTASTNLDMLNRNVAFVRNPEVERLTAEIMRAQGETLVLLAKVIDQWSGEGSVVQP